MNRHSPATREPRALRPDPASLLMGADFQTLRKEEVNMAHPTPFEAIAAAIESANIDFPDAGDGTTWEHIYRSTEECNHLARAVIAGLEKWGYFHRPESTGRILIASDKSVLLNTNHASAVALAVRYRSKGRGARRREMTQALFGRTNDMERGSI
jgi:hypothetical protein